MAKLLSSTLSTTPAALVPPPSKNCTSSVEPGDPLGFQFPAVDQFVLAPAGVQTLPGGGAPTWYVKTLMSPAVKSEDPLNVLAPVTVIEYACAAAPAPLVMFSVLLLLTPQTTPLQPTPPLTPA